MPGMFTRRLQLPSRSFLLLGPRSVGKTTWLLCLANLLIGVANLLGGRTISIINLLCAALLSYGLGRIHGKKESLESERLLHE